MSSENIKYIRPNFWAFQIIGWLVFAGFDYFASLEYYFIEFPGMQGRIKWFLLIFIGFFITLILRLIYKTSFIQRKTISNKLIIMLFFSLSGGLLWMLARNLTDAWIFAEGGAKDLKSLTYGFSNINHAIVGLGYYTSYFFGWSILYFGIKTWFSLNDERLKSVQAIDMANKAQLKMLRYQLNPHFLFNSLNSLQALMYKDVKKADMMLTELSEFLRFSLKFNSDIYIFLKDEFEIAEKYLFVEKVRFNDNINYRLSLPYTLHNEKILCFLTQPFIENAIKHGIKNNPYSMIDISMEVVKENGKLKIIIRNSGKWMGSKDLTGTGLSNARERLSNAYENNFSLEIDRGEQDVSVIIQIPCYEE